jgi:eukaryotic-like serine/threonine-protein kinase
MDDPYGFDWMALWPLIAIALHRQDSSAAIGFARGLLAENQHPLPEKLLSPIRNACDEWQNGAYENATAELVSAMNVARELSYL